MRYWRPKIVRNVKRDQEDSIRLKSMGWKVNIMRECELKKRVFDQTLENLIEEINRGGGTE